MLFSVLADQHFLHLALWTYISCTLPFGPKFLALDDDDGDSKCEDDEAARVSSL